MEAFMNATLLNREQWVAWSVASRAAPGETISGDLHLVCKWPHGVLIAVVDGLGHGEDASLAARIAVGVLASKPGDSVISLVQECHRALRSTRGAVMTLVSLNTDDDTATMIGVGNVEAVLVRADPEVHPERELVLLRSGVVGCELPTLRASLVPFKRGDVVVLATDGIREDFAQEIKPQETPVLLVDGIMARKYRGRDDGLVLACKYLGKS
jgi:serine phosphatase RsbU (regulator of sigma subunit)